MLRRLLITGAAGNLGRMARRRVAHLAEIIRLSDIARMHPAGANEEVVVCDLADAASVESLVAGCDGILHFGAISREDRFSRILGANIQGVLNLYEAARKNGCPPIFFASSNHTIGYHRQDERLDASAALMPDSLYGVSKCFGEAIASLYYHKCGQQTAIARIGSCFPEPADHRMLSTWLSFDDLVSLIECVFRAPRLGCPVIYGASNNDRSWWDNRAAAYLGWKPHDNAEAYREKLDETAQLPDRDSAAAIYQGGKFAAEPIPEE